MNIGLILASFFIILSFSVYSGSIAVLVVQSVMFLGGLALCRWGVRDREELFYSVKTFCFVFWIYAACAFFAVYFYRVSGEEFLFCIDQNSFLKFSNWALEEGSVWGIVQDTYFSKSDFWADVALFRCAQGIVAYLSHTYLGGHCPEVLVAFSYGFSAFVPIFLYKILVFKLSFRDAFKYALLFAAFSHLLYYSALIIRDIPVLFVFTMAFWFFLREFTFARLVGIGIMLLCAFSLRPESGILFLPLAIMYVWSKTQGRAFRVPLLGLGAVSGILVLLFMGGRILSSLSGYADIASGYADFTFGENMDSGGLSVYIAILPVGIREFVRILNGFFPVITGLSTIASFFRFGYPFPSVIHLSLLCVGHFFLAILFLKSCFNVERIWRFLRQDRLMCSCVIGTLPLILGNSVSYSHRRVLFAYLLLYVLYLFATRQRKVGGGVK